MIFSTVNYTGIEYDGYVYPPWSEAIGWLLAVLVLLPLPVHAIYCLCRCIGSCQNFCWILRAPRTVRLLNLRSLVVPDKLWGPALENSRSPTTVYEADAPPETPDAGYAVAYHEGRCFVTNSAFYSQSIDDSHIWINIFVVNLRISILLFISLSKYLTIFICNSRSLKSKCQHSCWTSNWSITTFYGLDLFFNSMFAVMHP